MGVTPGQPRAVSQDTLNNDIQEVRDDLNFGIPAPNHLVEGESYVIPPRRTIFAPSDLVLDAGSEIVLSSESELILW